MAYPQDLSQYVYAPEIGLQRKLEGINIETVNGTSYLLKPDNTTPRIGKGIIIVRKTIGLPNVYVAKKQDFEIVDTWGDLSHRKFKIKGLTDYRTGQPYRLNKVNVRMTDTTVIESILADYLTYNHGAVMTILKGITDSKENNYEKLYKTMAVIESVIELRDSFFDLLKPYEETFLPVPEGLTDKGTDKGNTKEPGTETPPPTATTSSTKTIIGVSALAVAFFVMKKKKII